MSPTSSLAFRIAETVRGRCTHDSLASHALELGIVVPDLPEGTSKRDRLLAGLQGKASREIAEIARKTGEQYCDFALEEAGLAALEISDPPLTEISRRDVARCYDDDLTGEQDLLGLLRRFFAIDDPFANVFGGRSLVADIEQHMIRNQGDWSVEFLFERIGALGCSRDRFARLVEASLHPLARRGKEQTTLAEKLNAVLRRDGYQVEIAGEESGYPVYRFTAIHRGVAGAPKNLVFASIGPKPEIGLRDAINNDIVILSNAESCLIYERPLRADGLLWSELVEWFAAGEGREAADPARALGERLRASLASDAERTFFDCFFKLYRRRLGARLPALVPQVYLHYDPAVVRRLQHRAGLPRQRMDFLLLLPARARVVLEVDGTHHFSRDGKPSLDAYSGMAAADRDLRLAGYEVYRFGANELVGLNAAGRISGFFDRLLALHGIALRTEETRDGLDTSAR